MSTHIVHVITGLYVGGAERSALKIIQGLPKSKFRTSVLSLLTEGSLTEDFRQAGAEVISLGLGLGEFHFSTILKAREILKNWRPDLIQGWMYHGNLLATFAGAGQAPVLWNIRQCLYDLSLEKPTTQMVIRGLRLLSWHPKKIIYNSHLSLKQHGTLGFRTSQSIVIDNGVDVQKFSPAAPDLQFYKELGLPSTTPLVGHVGRWHPLKDHETLLKAAHIILEARADVHFVLVGTQVEERNPELNQLLNKLNWPLPLRARLHFLGEQKKPEHIINQFQVLINSSTAEGSPNVVLEAMASGCACVVTDVGDSARLIEGVGILVRPSEPEEIATAALHLLNSPSSRQQLQIQARNRVKAEFSLEKSLQKYEELYRQFQP